MRITARRQRRRSFTPLCLSIDLSVPIARSAFQVRHRQDSWAIRMGEVVMAASRADQIPALRFDCLNDILALQISPIARMLVRP